MKSVTVAADVDDTRSLGGEDLVHDEVGEEKWTQVVVCKLHLKSIDGRCVGDSHDAGVVHEDINVRDIFPRVDGSSSLTHRSK